MDCAAVRIPVCVLTTTRADYGILRPLLRSLAGDNDIELRLAVTGTHLLEAFGMTVREIEADNLPIDVRIPIFSEKNDSPETMTHSMARTMERFGTYFQSHRPALLIVLGDRFEVFAVCAAAVAACIPIAHIHGGETTEGAMDEYFRHCITKMSYLHFTAAEDYRKRVIQMGEAPERVFNIGALGVENAMHVVCLEPKEMEDYLSFPLFSKPYAVVTFHPVTLEAGEEIRQLNELLSAIDKRQDMNFLITKSNADIGGAQINEMIDTFSRSHLNCCVVVSMGMSRYMSALKYASCVMGNSSSGLIEAPSFGIPTINIGNRQRGRMKSESVIDCAPEEKAILQAMDTAFSEHFRAKAASAVNPYGDGKTSERMHKIIKFFLFSDMPDLRKQFFDLDFNADTRNGINSSKY